MKFTFLSVFLLLPLLTYAQVTLDADGPGDTYDLITSVLAPGENPIEVPDCNHEAFGDHIDEVFDAELDKHVFRFHIHTTPDNDRCINFDRQRNEIKSYSQSPDNLKAIVGEKVVYKWKFKLSDGFQTSPNFTHLHQLKTVGGDLSSTPMYTLTARKGSPDQLELRYAETDDQVTLKKTDLAPFIDTWIDVTETIEYGTEGTYELEIKRVSDDAVLFSYSDFSTINWQGAADFVRPKWGIYRSLDNAQDLRDETVLFADFSIEELGNTTSDFSVIDDSAIVIYSNPVARDLYISGLPQGVEFVQLISIDGRQVMMQVVGSESAIKLDVTTVPNGSYVVKIRGGKFNHAEVVVIAK